MNSLQTNYQALITDENEAPHESVIFHVASEDSVPRWNHIVDLDAFFSRVYRYHQSGGYKCIMTGEIIKLALFVFIGYGFIYCSNCIYFNFDHNSSPLSNSTVTSLDQLFMDVAVCSAHFGFFTWILIIALSVVLCYKLYRLIDEHWRFREIQLFYETVMKIYPHDLPNMTWHDIVCHLREVQHEQQMCVNNTDLNELDISHRILRTTNYLVALINKNILPLKFSTRFFGELVCLSSQLEDTLIFLLFASSSFSPFKAPGKLKEEYKKREERMKCAAELSRSIFIIGIGSLILSPIIFCWRILEFILDYSGYLRFEPGFLGHRRWSKYSKLYLRHFNELNHELHKRLARASKPSKQYMRSFSSPLFVLVNKFLVKLSGFVIVFFTVWGVFVEQLFTLPYVLVIISAGAALFHGLASCVPDEDEANCPNELMQKIVADIHYVPDHFKTMAHTTTVRDEFTHLFPYALVIILEEIFSPLLTPWFFIFHLRPRALDIVDFIRNFTVHVDGVGDVCSFALMDVSRHGNPQWLGHGLSKADQRQQAEDGKTELSVIHFSLMNPNWEPPASSNIFIQGLREQVHNARDRCPATGTDPFYNSLNSVSTMGSKYASLVNSIHQSMHQSQPGNNLPPPSSSLSSSLRMNCLNMTKLTQAEGPAYYSHNGIWTSITENQMEGSSLNPIEARTADMSLSALFLHEIHDKHMGSLRSEDQASSQSEGQPRQNDGEESPLLEIRMGENYGR